MKMENGYVITCVVISVGMIGGVMMGFQRYVQSVEKTLLHKKMKGNNMVKGKYDDIISDFNPVPLVIDWNIHRNKIAVENNMVI